MCDTCNGLGKIMTGKLGKPPRCPTCNSPKAPKAICEALGLPPTATITQCVGVIQALQESSHSALESRARDGDDHA